jgi:hypothetical protein
MNNTNLPQWARDRLRAEDQMGTLEDTAPPLAVVGVLIGLSIRLGIFLGFCVMVYLIGRAIVT